MATRMPTVAALRYMRCFGVVDSFKSRPDTITFMGIDMHARTAIVDVRIKIKATESVTDASVAMTMPVHHSKLKSTGGFACAFFWKMRPTDAPTDAMMTNPHPSKIESMYMYENNLLKYDT